jgi:hypothetical protein
MVTIESSIWTNAHQGIAVVQLDVLDGARAGVPGGGEDKVAAVWVIELGAGVQSVGDAVGLKVDQDIVDGGWVGGLELVVIETGDAILVGVRESVALL